MMGKGACVLLGALASVALLPRCHSQGSVRVTIASYTHNSTLSSGDSVPLGTQIILVCQVVGLPYGTPLSYTWNCPNGSCEVEGYYGRKVYNEHILAVNTTSTNDGGTYACHVTATGQELTGNFTLTVTGGSVVHSYGRLIPHEFSITDLQQISGPDGIGRITCTVSSGTAWFIVLEAGGVSQTKNGATAKLVVNTTNVGSFWNRDLYCIDVNTNYFYLFLSSANPFSVPSLTDSVTNSAVEYQVRRNDYTNNRMIAGYEVIRFGVPMIGQYVNTGRGRNVTISPAIPGTQYRIAAWALSDRRRSATPAVVNAITGEAEPSPPRMLLITRILAAGLELNWLPPTEPNGEVHYVIYYTPEGGTEQSMDTGSDLTHYNLTGLERNRVYTNIAVQAVNSAGRSERSAVIAQYNHTPPAAGPQPMPTVSPQPSQLIIIVIAVAATTVLLLLVVVVVMVGLVVVMVTVVCRRRRKEHVYENTKIDRSVRVPMMTNSLQSTTYYEPMSPNIGPSHPHRQPHPLAIPHINTPNTGDDITMEDCPAYQSMDMHTSGEHTYI